MTRDKLLARIHMLNLEPPTEGTGLNKRVLNADLEEVIAQHYISEITDPNVVQHLKLRRSCTPMKSYRYDKLHLKEQQFMFDSSDWIAEEKLNGWRMMLTYIPSSGFMAWGGNIGVDCLPINYTEHLDLGGLPLFSTAGMFHASFVMDCEALINDPHGFIGGSQLENLEKVLGGGPELVTAYKVEGVTVHLHAFDFLSVFDKLLHKRKEHLRYVVATVHRDNLHEVQWTTRSKKEYLNTIWRRGGEGVILKNKYSPYVPGSRDRHMSIKVKRTMSGEIGDEIDAFITGYTLTKEYSKEKLIGSIELSVYVAVEGKDPYAHVIANVSSMPDEWRERLTTHDIDGTPELDKEVYGLVLRVDGQELTNKNRLLQHAVIDWDAGFHQKNSTECTLDASYIEDTKF